MEVDQGATLPKGVESETQKLVGGMRCKDLKDLLSIRDLATSGSQAELAERLSTAVMAPLNADALKKLGKASLQMEAELRGVEGKTKAKLIEAILAPPPEASKKRSREEDKKAAPLQLGMFKQLKLEQKAVSAAGSSQPEPKPEREKPQPGSQLLELHSSVLSRTGLGAGTRVVIADDGVSVYNAHFTQVDLATGINRFYIVQLIASGSNFYVYTHYGRIGEAPEEGRSSKTYVDFKLYGPCTKKNAITQFEGWFLKKAQCEFDNRHQFKQKPGGYNFIELSHLAPTGEKKSSHGVVVQSTLPPRIKELVQLVFDEDKILESMKEQGIKIEELPLGKLNIAQIKSAREVLIQLKDQLAFGPDGAHEAAAVDEQEQRQRQRIWQAKIQHLSTKFYEIVPQRDPKLIENEEAVAEKWLLLDTLEDICTGMAINDELGSGDVIHELDEKYKKLNTDFRVVDRGSEEFNLVEKYVKNTHGITHNTYKLSIVDLFAVTRQGEAEQYEADNFHMNPNRKLLWHGSRISNWAAIISQGLRIAPPEAPVTGYMFGKGLYYADVCTKSANYCFATKAQDEGIIMLSEVALGEQHVIKASNSDLPKGMPKKTISVQGEGRYRPRSSMDETLPDGTVVPLGIPDEDKAYDGVLLYNEFIVYKKHQQKARYILRVKFNWTDDEIGW